MYKPFVLMLQPVLELDEGTVRFDPDYFTLHN
jgi:hypothetical protein